MQSHRAEEEDILVIILFSQIMQTSVQKREQIIAKFPRLNRFLTGYDLERMFTYEQDS